MKSAFGKTVTQISEEEFSLKFPYDEAIQREIKNAFKWDFDRSDKSWHLLITRSEEAKALLRIIERYDFECQDFAPIKAIAFPKPTGKVRK